MAADEFERTVEQLYAGPPDRFIAQRDAAAKQARAAGDKELADRLKALRRPTVAAALLNELHRRNASTGLDELLELGHKLRAAQRKLDVKSMKSLSAERNSLISRLIDEIADTAQEPLSNTVQEQLSDTLVAAVADAAAGRAVGSGRLVSSLRYSGFGEVDLQDAVAIPLRAQPEEPEASPADEAGEVPDTDTDDVAEQQRAHQQAAAERELTEATAALDAAQKAEAAAQQSAELAERALAAAHRTAKSTRARAEQAAAARSAAEQKMAAAEEAAAGTTDS